VAISTSLLSSPRKSTKPRIRHQCPEPPALLADPLAARRQATSTASVCGVGAGAFDAGTV
jgi:hypothetical protein